jgi:hypothetical protein
MYNEPVKSFFVIHEVVVLTGFTKHMLDYLAREDIFRPSSKVEAGRGKRRRYTYEDVVLLRALNSICAGKGKIRHLKAALLSFRKEFGPVAPGQRLEKQLFVVGDELCTYTGAEGGRQLRSGQLTLGFFVDLAVISQGVADCVEVQPGSNVFKLTQDAAREAEEVRQGIWAPMKAKRAVNA